MLFVNIEGSYGDPQDFQDNVIYYLDFHAPLKSYHTRLFNMAKNGSVGKVCKSGEFSVRLVTHYTC